MTKGTHSRDASTPAGKPVKVLVFAHVPPPHHGQSYMVQLMLDGLRQGGGGADRPVIECYHVDARISKELSDIGDFRLGKFLLLLWFCVKAVYYRFRYGVRNFYYIPAPGKRSALYRDWVVMGLCRPFFKNIILHWHAAGLAKWLETVVQIRTRLITFHFLKEADLSIVLSEYNRRDAEKLFAKRIAVVGNGIPDPCPEFEREVQPRRSARRAVHAALLAGRTPAAAELAVAGEDAGVVRVLYLAHCTREKGLFDALSGVCLANAALAQRKSRLSLRMVVAGNFLSSREQQEFEAEVVRLACAASVEYQGFVGGEKKAKLLRDSDLFCFPTFYQNENQPVNLIEAMAFGLPVLTTRWRSLPELLPVNYPGLVPIQNPAAISAAILLLLETHDGEGFRERFLKFYTLDRYLSELAKAFESLG